MKLMQFLKDGETRLGIILENGIVDVAASGADMPQNMAEAIALGDKLIPLLTPLAENPPKQKAPEPYAGGGRDRMRTLPRRSFYRFVAVAYRGKQRVVFVTQSRAVAFYLAGKVAELLEVIGVICVVIAVYHVYKRACPRYELG